MVGCLLVALSRYYEIQVTGMPKTLGYYVKTLWTAGEGVSISGL